MARRIISPEDAEENYGIVASHNEMDNGELRFRLMCFKDEETGYIRTQTEESKEGWQNAHCHHGLLETYIVQEGSIVFAEFKDGQPVCREYMPGDVFTVKPYIPHNVYMRKNSVIHTVKHGKAVPNPNKEVPSDPWKDKEVKPDWWEDTDGGDGGCKVLNNLKGEKSIEDTLKKYGIKNKKHATNKKHAQFSKVYMHFDNLIWQLPAWLFALLTIAVATLKFNSEATIFENNFISCYIFIALAIFGGIISYAMYRFRYHQIIERGRISQTVLSPQTLVQIFVISMVAMPTLICLRLIFGAELTEFNYFEVITIFILIAVFVERDLRKRTYKRYERLDKKDEYNEYNETGSY